jgi:cephalosporin-C deacetylase-like acetyl esterase
LVGAGLLDEIAPPSSVFAVFNRIASPKQIVIMPNATHESEGVTTKAYNARWGQWTSNLRHGNPPPVER